jgi:large subunit ribosomal protein L29
VKELKANRLREQTRVELEIQLQDLQEELQNIRLRSSLKQEGNPLRMRQLRRGIARIRTMLHEDDRGIRRLASGKEKA